MSSAAAAATPHIEEPRKPWPPPFETAGGSYVYASDTGLYWDPDSLFYYSPQTKLYYSTFQGKYYRCDVAGRATSDHPFEEYAPPVPADDSPFDDKQSPSAPSSKASPGAGLSMSLKLPAKKKAPISFGLKALPAATTKKLKSPGTAAASAVVSTSTGVDSIPSSGMMRKSAMDIAKWSQKQQEAKREQQKAGKANTPSQLPFDAPTPAADIVKPTTIASPTDQARKSSQPTTTAAAPSVVDSIVNVSVEAPICLVSRHFADWLIVALTTRRSVSALDSSSSAAVSLAR